ncbi:ATP-binding protein [Acidicapsa ligni]|uniref:ATP-binding protein n=1 Tax=Acidicapsa ligni TaxID=542300 RepID=UPI0021DFE335|nr:ATP-binding protein [Acidicapsa ligni]
MEDRVGGVVTELSTESCIANSMTAFGSPESLSFSRVPIRSGGLAALAGQQNSIASLAHDARNMVAALELYCDLLDEDGVLAGSFRHYSDELRLVAAGSRRLLEKMTVVERMMKRGGEGDSGRAAGDGWESANLTTGMLRGDFWANSGNCDDSKGYDSSNVYNDSDGRVSAGATPIGKSGRMNRLPAFWAETPIENLAEALLANQNLLSAVAGPRVTVTASVSASVVGVKLPIEMTGEDLTRVLVNLVKNAAEAMPSGGHVQIALEFVGEGGVRAGAEKLRLTVSDTGPGIPAAALRTIFNAGYTSRYANTESQASDGLWPAQHRGLGLSIVRSIVLAAGGTISAANRVGGKRDIGENLLGAEITLEFPVKGKGSTEGGPVDHVVVQAGADIHPQ